MSKERNIDTLPLDGGALCFHFINTVNTWRGGNLHEYLDSYPTLLQWCSKVNILTAKNRKALQQHAARHPEAAVKALQKIKQIRKLLYCFFSAIAAGSPQQLKNEQVQQFNAMLSAALSHLCVTVKGTQVEQGWQQDAADLLAPLWVVMKSAYDVLTQEDHARIKECGICGWIFLDHTKNNKRRWCNPLSCGSIEKSKKYYHKKKQEAVD
jgi:predicted RNA-binding Zn ribbon-like protein